ncbi:MAG TPA: L-serine ammonia-lyase, iron-sulfur-dependent, subunit alpha [Halanaerobiales bacterium]|nr:L-serine ammonia-lyase, iron-sulfur-dependent, subunit alpha [Halanaerobiales bacterium]
MSQYSSIFNDVFGPIMRGPSSSHVAGAARIGLLSKQLTEGNIKKVITQFDPKGSLATTYDGHGSDIGLVGGILGLNPDDKRLPESLKIAQERDVEIKFEIKDYEATHPNTYKLIIYNNKNKQIDITALSTGGGMVELIKINDFGISIKGDFFETLIFVKTDNKKTFNNIYEDIKNKIDSFEFITYSENNNNYLINIKTFNSIDLDIIEQITAINEVYDIKRTNPVLPIKSRKNTTIPFNTTDEMIEISKEKDLKMWELATLYESARGDMPKSDVYKKMEKIIDIMNEAVNKGISGTKYEDRILGPQAWMVKDANEKDKLIPTQILNNVITYTMAVMEVKSSMGLIVASPTAGSCGVIPGSIIGVFDTLNLDKDKLIKAMLSSAIIGILISEKATFAGEEAGCQAECGSASSMAAAGLVQLMDGTVEQCIKASSIALQNILGLICDPVANRVEVPCLGRNIIAATNAIASANMALAGIDEVIPLEEVIDSMYNVGNMMPSEICCTGLGGLSVTNTAKNIEKNL